MVGGTLKPHAACRMPHAAFHMRCLIRTSKLGGSAIGNSPSNLMYISTTTTTSGECVQPSSHHHHQWGANNEGFLVSNETEQSYLKILSLASIQSASMDFWVFQIAIASLLGSLRRGGRQNRHGMWPRFHMVLRSTLQA